MKQTASPSKQAPPLASWTTARTTEEAARLLPHLNDEEQAQLFTASRNMFDALSNGFGGIVKLMEASPNIARTIGETAALVCWHASGTEPGRTLPTKVFAMHDGVLAQTVDSLGQMADGLKIQFTEFEKRLALQIALQHYTIISTSPRGESN